MLRFKFFSYKRDRNSDVSSYQAIEETVGYTHSNYEALHLYHLRLRHRAFFCSFDSKWALFIAPNFNFRLIWIIQSLLWTVNSLTPLVSTACRVVFCSIQKHFDWLKLSIPSAGQEGSRFWYDVFWLCHRLVIISQNVKCPGVELKEIESHILIHLHLKSPHLLAILDNWVWLD